jgi:hypothetical protein
MDRPGFRVSEVRALDSSERADEFVKESSPGHPRSFFLQLLLLFDVTLLDLPH